MCGPEDPLFTPFLPLARVPFQAKESVHKTPFWENLEILASTASIFTQVLAHKPQIWKFLALKPPFSEANVSSQAPHFGNLGCTPLPEKKLSAPPGGWAGALGRSRSILQEIENLTFLFTKLSSLQSPKTHPSVGLCPFSIKGTHVLPQMGVFLVVICTPSHYTLKLQKLQSHRIFSEMVER